MKKKEIEKVPYLTLPKVSRKKAVKFVGVTAFKNIKHERHLFLEVYRNDKQMKTIPVVRIVITKKDFGNYFPQTGEWTRQKIEINPYYSSGELLWHTREDRAGTRHQEQKENILFCDNDLDRIKKVCDVNVYQQERWWEYIYRHEDNIITTARRKAADRKYQRRQQALADREQNTPELPEQEILKWADGKLFNNRHYLYYKKKGRRAQICCSACGGVAEGAWKATDSYEGMFEKTIAEPVNKNYGICPLCGEIGVYQQQGRANGQYGKIKYCFKADKYKDTGAVVRYIEIEKRYVLEEYINDKGETVMNGAHEEMYGIEIARTYLEGNKKPQTDFHKHNPYSGKDYWDDCNLYGMTNIKIESAPLYPGFSEKLEGTPYQYSAIERYAEAKGAVNANWYMQRYQEIPQIEMLVKLQLYDIAQELVRYNCGIIRNSEAKSLDGFFGIKKERSKFLIQNKGDTRILQILQLEKEMSQNWTEEQIKAMAEIEMSKADMITVMRYMSLQKALNRIKKYAGCEYGTGCTTAVERLRHTKTTYVDYLYMRNELGYDMSNTVYLAPRNIENAHNKMLQEKNKAQQEYRKKEVEERFPLIRKNYRKLRNRFYHEDENYLIRPARSAGEIVDEGRILHHCVGGDNYLRKHNEGDSYILFLRFKNEPDIPYVTVEITKDLRINQWYGAQDKKPDEENLQRWLKAYVLRLKTMKKEDREKILCQAAG